MPEIYDVIVIGAGPAGITAAVYAARKKLNLLVVTGDVGGQAAWSGEVENYTGFNMISGPELASKFDEHLKQFNIPLKEAEETLSLSSENGVFKAKTAKGVYLSKSIIIASGKRSREMNVPGEKEFKNKGLTYCATCDGPLFAGKEVAVIGGGNSALDAAIQLSRYCSKVSVINNTPALGGDKIMREQVLKHPAVFVLNGVKVEGVLGEKFVSGLRISGGKEGVSDIPVKGIFVEIGLLPNSEFAGMVKRNASGEILVDSGCATDVPGIFAAGDVTNVAEKQIIIAAGEGAKAALAAFKYLVMSGKLGG